MRFSVIKYEEEETTYYNPKAFYRDENMIIFPFEEFDSFYNEMVQSLNVVKNILNEALSSDSPHPPIRDLERVEDWINLLSEDVDLLLKFKMQSTLESFRSRNSARIKFSPKNLENSSFQSTRTLCVRCTEIKDFDCSETTFCTAPQIENEIPTCPKEEIQCLMGL
jgi:hypothetical protein